MIEKIGQILFKFRSYTPIPLIFMIFRFTGLVSVFNFIFGLIVVIIGEFLRIWGVGYAGPATRTRNAGADSLVVSGPFRHTRNPLYIGNYFIAIGLSIITGKIFICLFTTIFYYVQYYFIIRHEEGVLKGKFGEDYKGFLSSVPRLFPQIRPCEKDSKHKLELKEALKSEKATFMNILVFILFFAYKMRKKK